MFGEEEKMLDSFISHIGTTNLFTSSPIPSSKIILG
jgi:hypothetical protein